MSNRDHQLVVNFVAGSVLLVLCFCTVGMVSGSKAPDLGPPYAAMFGNLPSGFDQPAFKNDPRIQWLLAKARANGGSVSYAELLAAKNGPPFKLVSQVADQPVKPILIEFRQDYKNCLPCRRMIPAVAKVKAAGHLVKDCNVDTDEGREYFDACNALLPKDEQITITPTFIVIDAEGKTLGRIDGQCSEADLLQLLKGGAK